MINPGVTLLIQDPSDAETQYRHSGVVLPSNDESLPLCDACSDANVCRCVRLRYEEPTKETWRSAPSMTGETLNRDLH